MNEWKRITCAERESIVAEIGDNLSVSAAYTDLYGEFGEPEVFTEWFDKRTCRAVLKESRFPSLTYPIGIDRKPCEHFAAARGEGEQE